MSSSTGTDSTIFLSDSPETIAEKVKKYAFSAGGQKDGDGTLTDHLKYGGRPQDDMSYQYLRYFEMDDARLAEVFRRFTLSTEKGDVITEQYSCNDLKELLIEKLVELTKQHQEKKAAVTPEILKGFYERKRIPLPKQKEIPMTEDQQQLVKLLDAEGIQHETIYHAVITTMDQGEEVMARVNGTICKVLHLKGKEKYYLFVTTPDPVDLKEIASRLDEKKIRFADSGKMMHDLKVPQGCATPFALIHKPVLELVVDRIIPNTEPVNFHPLRNDATTTVSYQGFVGFAEKLGYTPRLV